MVCSASWNHDEWFRVQGHGGCPNCHTKIAPMDTNHNGYIEVNWYELVMLATYAKRWSKVAILDTDLAVQTIMALENVLKRLSKYRPEGAMPLYPEHDSVQINITKSENVSTTDLPKQPEGLMLSPFYQPKQGPLI